MKLEIACPDCGSSMKLRETAKFKTKDGKNHKFYGCSSYPSCNATHGAHPDGTPLGIAASKEVKELRMKAHKEAELVWGKWDIITGKQKAKMYAWMEKNTKSGHIGKMMTEELLDVIKKIKALNLESSSEEK